MDKTPESYQQLASFLSRTIFSQVASEEDVGHALRGDAEPTGAEGDRVPPPQNPLERPATECIAVPPPSTCFPPPQVERDDVAEDEYLREFHADVANITTKANTHTCTFTCHKHGHANSCRYVNLLSFCVLPSSRISLCNPRLPIVDVINSVLTLHPICTRPFSLYQCNPFGFHQIWFRQGWEAPCAADVCSARVQKDLSQRRQHGW